jgi:DNA processing protein
MTSREAFIALNMVADVGPVRVRQLLDAFGSPEKILQAPRSELKKVDGIGEEVAKSITKWRENVRLDDELARIERENVRVVTQLDDEFPQNLREIHDPPLVLYVRGALKKNEKLAVAVVGTRRPTHYGQESARKLAYQLAHCGVAVISGGARGIDTAAHRGALQAKGRTIAVVGTGLDVIYPAENKKLFDEIAESGAVVTEFPFGTKPTKTNFPMRNRILSGWSLGVIVVEAGLHSGASITATQAAEQGRQVFAVPGRIDSPMSKGTHRLIKEGAKLTEDVEDVLSEFEFLTFRRAESEKSDESATISLTETEQKIVNALAEQELSPDEIIAATGLTSAEVSSTLLALEMKRVVKQLPGRRFARVR